MAKASKKKKSRKADNADRHVLYEQAVQDSEAEVGFVSETFEELRGRKAHILREDFCGTASVACEWAKLGRDHHAIGVDLDEEVLAWGREHNLAKLPAAAQQRVELIKDNVLTVKTSPADAAVAMNFSYWIFKDRKTLKGYFENVRAALKDDGVLFMDCFGGSDAFEEMTEKREIGKFTYIWDQASFNPINNHITCHIHFSFPDKSKMKKAFTYEWRLWTIPEIREVLEEAGFSRSVVYWQETDEDSGEGTGEFFLTEEGEADPAWVSYIVALK